MDTDFVEFRQLQEVGVFSYMIYSLAKIHFNGQGFVKAWMDAFGPKIFRPSEENP